MPANRNRNRLKTQRRRGRTAKHPRPRQPRRRSSSPTRRRQPNAAAGARKSSNKRNDANGFTAMPMAGRKTNPMLIEASGPMRLHRFTARCRAKWDPLPSGRLGLIATGRSPGVPTPAWGFREGPGKRVCRALREWSQASNVMAAVPL